eukprot:11607357-Alexandrium_andersonii.AAC.1
MRNLQNRFRCSKLELRSRGARSARFLASSPKLPTKAGTEGVRGREHGKLVNSNLQSSNPHSAQSLAIGAREPS